MKIHINPGCKMETEQERMGLFPSILSPFYRVCMEFCASVSISASVSVVVNQA